jgi:hypothetical protein
VTATGDVPKSTGASSTNYVATVSTATFSKCTGLGFSIAAKLNKPVYLWVSKATTTAGYLGGPNGKSTNAVSFSYLGSALGGGNALVTGSYLPASYSNANHRPNIDLSGAKTLTLTHLSGCIGDSGSKVGITTPYAVSQGLTINNM